MAAVVDRVLTTSMASDAAVGDLFGLPDSAVSIPLFDGEPARAPEPNFNAEPTADLLLEPNPPSPPSATFDARWVTAPASVAVRSLAAAFSSLTADVAAFSSWTADTRDFVALRLRAAGDGRGDIVLAAITDGEAITGWAAEIPVLEGAAVLAAFDIADGRGWTVPAAIDGTGPSGTPPTALCDTRDGTTAAAVVERALALSRARIADWTAGTLATEVISP